MKPENVFLDSYNQAALGDFGISTFSEAKLTTTKAMAYTVRFAPPEVLDGTKQTVASDIYSTGVTLLEILVGAPAFTAETTSGMMRQIFIGNACSMPESVPQPLRVLVNQMMAIDPADRPASAAEAALELQSIQRSQGLDPTPAHFDKGVVESKIRVESAVSARPQAQASPPMAEQETVPVSNPAAEPLPGVGLPLQPAQPQKGRPVFPVLAAVGITAGLVFATSFFLLRPDSDSSSPVSTVVSDPTAASDPASTAETEPTTLSTEEAPDPSVSESGSVDTSTKPEVTIMGEAPSVLRIEDIVVGDGAEVAGDVTVSVDYVGVAWTTKEEFDSSWEREAPASFSTDGVIEGWREGLQGMRVGGRRKLTIPPEMAYGSNPPTDVIAPNETLVFVVDLREIK